MQECCAIGVSVGLEQAARWVPAGLGAASAVGWCRLHQGWCGLIKTAGRTEIAMLCLQPSITRPEASAKALARV